MSQPAPGVAALRYVPPVSTASARSPARTASIGMGTFIAADAATFVALIVAAWVLRGTAAWNAPGTPSPGLGTGALATAILLSSSAVLGLGRRRAPRLAMAAAAILGAAFVAVAAREWRALAAAGLATGESRFADAFFVITGYHALHVAAGSVALAVAAARRAGPGPRAAIAAYWHFVDAAWLGIAATLYL